MKWKNNSLFLSFILSPLWNTRQKAYQQCILCKSVYNKTEQGNCVYRKSFQQKTTRNTVHWNAVSVLFRYIGKWKIKVLCYLARKNKFKRLEQESGIQGFRKRISWYWYTSTFIVPFSYLKQQQQQKLTNNKTSPRTENHSAKKCQDQQAIETSGRNVTDYSLCTVIFL